MQHIDAVIEHRRGTDLSMAVSDMLSRLTKYRYIFWDDMNDKQGGSGDINKTSVKEEALETALERGEDETAFNMRETYSGLMKLARLTGPNQYSKESKPMIQDRRRMTRMLMKSAAVGLYNEAKSCKAEFETLRERALKLHQAIDSGVDDEGMPSSIDGNREECAIEQFGGMRELIRWGLWKPGKTWDST